MLETERGGMQSLPIKRIERRTAGTILAFKAPRDAQLTATDLGEWAWERAAAPVQRCLSCDAIKATGAWEPQRP